MFSSTLFNDRFVVIDTMNLVNNFDARAYNGGRS